MERIKVLLIEDGPTLAMIIRGILDGSESGITLATSGKKGLSRYTEIKSDIIVVDVIVPETDGFMMVKLIRKMDTHIPVLFLPARSAANDVVEGFGLNSNDYLKKPLGMAGLIVRIKALPHKVSIQRPEATSFRIGLYTFDSITQTLVYRGEKQLLSNRESEILKRLCNNKDRILPMKGILIDLWGDDSFSNAHSLRVFITKLRHRLSKDRSIRILNIRGVGYRLIIDWIASIPVPSGPDMKFPFHDSRYQTNDR